jgi:hypothetical protein
VTVCTLQQTTISTGNPPNPAPGNRAELPLPVQGRFLGFAIVFEKLFNRLLFATLSACYFNINETKRYFFAIFCSIADTVAYI